MHDRTLQTLTEKPTFAVFETQALVTIFPTKGEKPRYEKNSDVSRDGRRAVGALG